MGGQEVIQNVSEGIGVYLDSPLFGDVSFHHRGPGSVVGLGKLLEVIPQCIEGGIICWVFAREIPPEALGQSCLLLGGELCGDDDEGHFFV